MPEWLVYILVIALTTFLVRALPFLLIRGPIRSPRLRAFLKWCPTRRWRPWPFRTWCCPPQHPQRLAGFLSAVLVGWLGGGLIRGRSCLPGGTGL